MEKFDIYNAQKLKTGEESTRELPLKSGQFRFIVRVIIFNKKADKVLLQKRQTTKSIFPDLWDFTAAGGVLAGENLAQAASRELFEELGITYDFSNVPSRLTVRFYEGWSEIFIIQKDVQLEQLKLQESEVAEVKWATETELKQMINKGKFIPFHYANQIFDYLRYHGETKLRN